MSLSGPFSQINWCSIKFSCVVLFLCNFTLIPILKDDLKHSCLQFEWNCFWRNCNCPVIQGNPASGPVRHLAFVYELWLSLWLIREFACARSFSLPEFVAEVQEMIRPVLTAYLKVAVNISLTICILFQHCFKRILLFSCFHLCKLSKPITCSYVDFLPLTTKH